MKKIIFVLATIMLFAISSCTNDEIEVITKGELHKMELIIKPQPMYDHYGFTDDVTTVLRKQSWNIGTYTLLYDEEGKLVTSSIKKQHTFNNINQSFELEEGIYTVVIIESLVDPDKSSFYPYYFSVKDINTLSTLKIAQIYQEVYFQHILGVCTKQIKINSDVQETLSPSPIGSIIKVRYFDYDKSDHVAVGFGTSDRMESYLLNPALSREDKFYKKLNTEGYFTLRGEDDDFTAKAVGMDIYVLEASIDYKFCFKKKENENTNTWSWWNKGLGTLSLQDGVRYYAGACYNESQGEYIITPDIDKYNTWVNDLNNNTSYEPAYVPELYMTWGGSVDNVQSFMSSYQMTEGTQGAGVAVGDGSYYKVSYKGKESITSITHYFQSRTTGLYEIVLFYNNNEVKKENLISYLNNNEYTDQGSDVYLSSDKKTISMPLELDNDIALVFLDYESLNTRKVETFTSYYQSRALQLLKEKNIAQQNHGQSFGYKMKNALLKKVE